MSNSITIQQLLLELSDQQQELLSGGQAGSADPLLTPITTLRGRPVNPIGKAINDG
jgi:hypothetical protein